MYKRVLKLKKSFLGEIESRSGYYCYLTFYEEHPRPNMLGVSFDRLFNPIQTGLFLAFPGLRGGGGVNRPPPLHFLKTMEVCIGYKISHDNEHLAIGGREGIPVSGAMSRNILVVDKLGAIPSVNVRISISFFQNMVARGLV